MTRDQVYDIMLKAGWEQGPVWNRWTKLYRGVNYIALFGGRSEEILAGYVYCRDWNGDPHPPARSVTLEMLINEHELNHLLSYMICLEKT